MALSTKTPHGWEVDPHRGTRTASVLTAVVSMALAVTGGVLAAGGAPASVGLVLLVLGLGGWVVVGTLRWTVRGHPPLVMDLEQRCLRRGARTIPLALVGPCAVWRTTVYREGEATDAWAMGVIVGGDALAAHLAERATPGDDPFREGEGPPDTIGFDGGLAEVLPFIEGMCDEQAVRREAYRISERWGSRVVSLPSSRHGAPQLSGLQMIAHRGAEGGDGARLDVAR
jgi:hypothetical protein